MIELDLSAEQTSAGVHVDPHFSSIKGSFIIIDACGDHGNVQIEMVDRNGMLDVLICAEKQCSLRLHHGDGTASTTKTGDVFTLNEIGQTALKVGSGWIDNTILRLFVSELKKSLHK